MTNKEAIRILSNMIHDDKAVYGYKSKPRNEALDLAIKALEETEKSQSEWIKCNFKTFGDWEYKCSNCEKVYDGEYNFCPNCGAKMKGGAELYREETCKSKDRCDDYKYWHCVGCNGCKKGGKK